MLYFATRDTFVLLKHLQLHSLVTVHCVCSTEQIILCGDYISGLDAFLGHAVKN